MFLVHGNICSVVWYYTHIYDSVVNAPHKVYICVCFSFKIKHLYLNYCLITMHYVTSGKKYNCPEVFLYIIEVNIDIYI